MSKFDDLFEKINARKGMPSDYSSNEKITDAMIKNYYSQCALV